MNIIQRIVTKDNAIKYSIVVHCYMLTGTLTGLIVGAQNPDRTYRTLLSETKNYSIYGALIGASIPFTPIIIPGVCVFGIYKYIQNANTNKKS